MKAALLVMLLLPLTACAAGDSPAIGMANPASVFCAEQGGRLELRNGAEGVTGYCHLPDGTVVEEWQFFRAHHGQETSGNQ